MKKATLTTTLLIAGALGAMAQGVVQFDNGPWNWTDGVDRNVYADFVGGTLLDNPAYKAGLFEDRSGTYVQLGELVSFDFGGATVPGVWSWEGNMRTISKTAGNAAANNTTLQVRIFDGSGNLLKASDPFIYRNSISDPPATADVLMNNFRAFAVPEPSTIALGVLGLGALLLFRRRK